MNGTTDITIEELAHLTRRHPETLRRLARLRQLPGAYKLGAKWLVRREALPEIRGEVEPIGAPQAAAGEAR